MIVLLKNGLKLTVTEAVRAQPGHDFLCLYDAGHVRLISVAAGEVVAVYGQTEKVFISSLV